MDTNSIFAHIYQAIIAQVTAANILDGRGIQLTYIAQDFGQLEALPRPPVAFPCLLIDFETATYTDDTDTVQEGECIILLRLAWNPYAADNSLVPNDVQAMALSYYDMEAALHSALQYWSDGYFSGLTRVSAATEKRGEDLLRVRQIRYSTSFKDDSAYSQATTPVPPLVITPEMTSPDGE